MYLEKYDSASKSNPSDLLRNITNTFFANVFSRHSTAFVEIPADMELDKQIPTSMYRYLRKALGKLGSICLKFCESVVAPVVAIVKKTSAGIVLVKNPQYYSYESLVCLLCPVSQSFKTVQTDPVKYWQENVEPVNVTEICYA